MKSVDKTEDKALVADVVRLWPLHHPLGIAFDLNARYGLTGHHALTATAIWNIHQAARRLDSKAAQA